VVGTQTVPILYGAGRFLQSSGHACGAVAGWVGAMGGAVAGWVGAMVGTWLTKVIIATAVVFVVWTFIGCTDWQNLFRVNRRRGHLGLRLWDGFWFHLIPGYLFCVLIQDLSQEDMSKAVGNALQGVSAVTANVKDTITTHDWGTIPNSATVTMAVSLVFLVGLHGCGGWSFFQAPGWVQILPWLAAVCLHPAIWEWGSANKTFRLQPNLDTSLRPRYLNSRHGADRMRPIRRLEQDENLQGAELVDGKWLATHLPGRSDAGEKYLPLFQGGRLLFDVTFTDLEPSCAGGLRTLAHVWQHQGLWRMVCLFFLGPSSASGPLVTTANLRDVSACIVLTLFVAMLLRNFMDRLVGRYSLLFRAIFCASRPQFLDPQVGMYPEFTKVRVYYGFAVCLAAISHLLCPIVGTLRTGKISSRRPKLQKIMTGYWGLTWNEEHRSVALLARIALDSTALGLVAMGYLMRSFPEGQGPQECWICFLFPPCWLAQFPVVTAQVTRALPHFWIGLRLGTTAAFAFRDV